MIGLSALFNWIFGRSVQPLLTMRAGGYTGPSTSLFSLHPHELVLSAPVVRQLKKHLDRNTLPKDLSRSFQSLLKKRPQPVSKAEFRRVCAAANACEPAAKKKSVPRKKKAGVTKRKKAPVSNGLVNASQSASS
tara:strand:- start:249 stop:650 length:402 start_codon:yes stop_codon:yes gene_type:complete